MLTKEKNKIIKLIKKIPQENPGNDEGIINQLNLILSEFEDLEKIKFLKNAEFLVDRRGTKKYNDFIKQLLEVSNISEYLKQYLNEVTIINKLFGEANRLQTKINKIVPGKRLSSMLVATQQMQSVAKNIGNPLYYDKLIEWINDGLKSLVYDNEIFDGKEFLYARKDYFSFGFFDDSLDIADQYVRDSIETAKFEEEYEEWKAGYRSFKIYNKKIVSIVSDKSIEFFYQTALKECIIDQLFTIYYAVMMGVHDIKQMEHSEERYKYNEFLLRRKYFCNCSEVKIENIPIREWMNAYFALKKYIKKQKYGYQYERVSFFHYGIRNKHSRTKDEWIEILTKDGVSKEYAKPLFELMVFHRKSVDVFDSPFVPCCGKYFVVPWLIEEMEVGRVLLSKFSDKSGIDFKGYAFENYILDVLKYCDIPATMMKNKNYQCDVAFVLDDVLFVCECKNRGSLKTNELFFDEMDDDIFQIERIAQFYRKNIGIVKKCFEDAGCGKITFSDVQKVIIYSKVLHCPVRKNGVLIMDLYKFLQPLSRDELTGYLVQKYPQIKESLTGRITAKKIIDYYCCPVNYFDYSVLFWQESHYKIGRYNIKSERAGFNDLREMIDGDFIFKYCLAKKAKMIHIQELYKKGSLSKQFVPPEFRWDNP